MIREKQFNSLVWNKINRGSSFFPLIPHQTMVQCLLVSLLLFLEEKLDLHSQEISFYDQSRFDQCPDRFCRSKNFEHI